MRFYFLLILLFILLLSCSIKQVPDCSRLKVGKFIYYLKFTDTRYVIERNDSIQTETNQTTDAVSKSKIKWLTPCDYQLIFLSRSPTDTSQNEIEKKAEAIPLNTKIIKTAKNYYVFESSKEGISMVLRDTIWYNMR